MENIISLISSRFAEKTYCLFINARNFVRGKLHRIHPSSESGIYQVTDGKDALFICRRNRHNRSKFGVKEGLEQLARQYHLDHVEFSPGDLLIDCGANIGELGAWAKVHKLNYVAFEPEELESRCINLNAFGGEEKTNRIALWHENTTLNFYSKPDTADGSVFEIDDFNEVRQVQAKRLDEVISEIDPEKKAILKIEAEGAEPEVLAGAVGLLKNIDYIAIDCGYERGKQKNHTFVETNRLLSDHGFRIEKVEFNRLTMLYKNVFKAQH